MIERIFQGRGFYPAFDGSFIEGIRLSQDPVIREMILWEYVLEPLLPHAIDLKMVRDEVNDFARHHGSLFSIRMALRWVGFPNARFVRLSRTDYEVDPGRLPVEKEISAIRAALAASVPARGILKRIFSGNFEVKF